MTRSRQTADWGSRAGLAKVIPSSITVGSGTGSADSLGNVTFSGASSISLNGIFTSAYENYRLIFGGITSSSSGIVQFWSRLRLSGTDASGATDYRTTYFRLYTGGTANGTSNGQNVMGLGYISTGDATFMTMDISRPAVAATTQMLFSAYTYQSDIATYIYANGANMHKLSTAYDGLTVTGDSGTFSGTVKVYGYN